MSEISQSGLELVAIALGVTLALRAFYSAFHSRWPENYFGGEDGVDPVVSRSPWRYATFRLVPVGVVLAAAGTAASRVQESRTLAIVISVVVYVVQGPVRALVRDWRATPRRVGLVVFRVVSSVGCLGVAAVTIALGGRVDDFVPEGEEFVAAAWTAVVVLALAHFARSVAAPRLSRNRAQLLARARAEVDPYLLDMLRDGAGGSRRSGFEALALAEQLNRPRWVRRVERICMRGNGSYGLMQVTSERPIGDRESVELFIEWANELPTSYWPADTFNPPRDVFLAHNPDTRFADLATNLFWALIDEELSTAAVAAPVSEQAGPELTVSVGDGPQRRPGPFVVASSGALVGAGLVLLVTRRRH